VILHGKYQRAITDAEGHRVTGREEVRRAYETSFARFPDGHCDLRSCIGNDGQGMAESFFRGTRPREGNVVEAIGAEVMEIRDAKIKEIRDYHRYFPAKAASAQRVNASDCSINGGRDSPPMGWDEFFLALLDVLLFWSIIQLIT